MKKSCDNCGNIDKYCDMFSNCMNCMYDNNLHDNWQPKPTDKDQTKAEDNKVKLKRRETCMYCGQKITAGQEDRDKEVEDLKGQTNKALIMTTNYMTENRQLIKQLEKRQHLQSLLDKAVELIKGYYPDTDYAEGVDHEDFIKVKKRLNKQAEQFLKDCKGE